MAKIGFIVTIHGNEERVKQVLSSLLNQGAVVALHCDLNMGEERIRNLEKALAHFDNILFVESKKCAWGDWSLVDAQIRAIQTLMKTRNDVAYFYGLSGSCLPLRSLEWLEDYIAQSEGKDFIESVIAQRGAWVQDGLHQERYLFRHPFNWQTQRRLFDLNVKLRRYFKKTRAIPEGLEMSFGSQWWCLSRETLEKIFNDPHYNDYVRFFKEAWIPDESFFQTLVRKHSPSIQSTSLTLSKFDKQGKPFIFYDDHKRKLQNLNRFAVRKIWSGANELYEYFLDGVGKEQASSEAAEHKLIKYLDKIKDEATHQPTGLLSQNHLPNPSEPKQSREKYYVLIGMDRWRLPVVESFRKDSKITVMGNLYHPNRVEIDYIDEDRPRATKDLLVIRNYVPFQFLQQMVWVRSPQKVLFFTEAHHIKRCAAQIVNDENSQLIMIKGAWFFDVYERNRHSDERVLPLCKVHIQRERSLLNHIERHEGDVSDRIHVLSIGEVLRNPEKLQRALPTDSEIAIPQEDFDDIANFAQRLANRGVDIEDLELLNLKNIT